MRDKTPRRREPWHEESMFSLLIRLATSATREPRCTRAQRSLKGGLVSDETAEEMRTGGGRSVREPVQLQTDASRARRRHRTPRVRHGRWVPPH